MNQKQLSKEEEEKFKSKLRDRKWRLRNLYWIINKEGKKEKFTPNIQQTYLEDNLHHKNFILKARQIGFTTFIDILALDSALFYPNTTAIIIAHTREHAEKIFDKIVRHAWDNLPDWLKMAYKLNADSAKMLKFENNNSSIEVSTSARSATAQFLHISELGTMAQKYPEKAKEIITGSLNAVPPKGLIFIESTAKGRDGYFFRLYQLAKKAKEMEVLTEMDYRLFFFPWWEEKSYRIEVEISIPIDYENYFEEVERKIGSKIDIFQKGWYVKKSQEMLSEGKENNEMKSEFPSYAEEAFEASIEGSYYATQMSRMRTDKRITRVPWNPEIDVNTYWDLGMNDSMVIIFTQTVGKELRIIDYYENSGEGFIHYIKYLKERPYKYGKHVFPFDVEVRELGTGKSRKEVLQSMGLTVTVVKKLEISHGIEAVRNLLPMIWIDEVKVSRLVNCLDNYRKEWDDRLGDWKNNAVHDEYSHGADAMRTLGVHYKPHVEMVVYEEELRSDDFDKYGLFENV